MSVLSLFETPRAPFQARTERLSSLTQNSFHMRRRGNRNLDRNNGDPALIGFDWPSF